MDDAWWRGHNSIRRLFDSEPCMTDNEMPSRVAVLEQIAADTRQMLVHPRTELRSDLKEVRTELHSSMREMRTLQWSHFRPPPTLIVGQFCRAARDHGPGLPPAPVVSGAVRLTERNPRR
jgi:hypothetical protein